MPKLKPEDLTLDQKLGLTLCSRRCHEQEDLDTTLAMIRDHAVGCVQVRIDENSRALINRLKAEADYPILYINDMEQGYPLSELPKLPALTLAACDDPRYYRDFAEAIVARAQADGFVGTWGPVLDILTMDMPCTSSRDFGCTPEAVLKGVTEIHKVFHEHHFLGCGKHFGGVESQPVDTHMVEGTGEKTAEEFLSWDFVPYRELMKKGLLRSVMTAHTRNVKIDPDLPASLSPKMIGLLRNAGFDGLVFTDSLAMMGILQKYGEGHAMGLAIAAGNDIVLPNYRTPHAECVRMLREEYDKGTFTLERLNDAVRHILAAMDYVSEPAAPAAVTDSVRASYEAVPGDAVTAITDPGLTPALPKSGEKRLFIVLTPQEDGALGIQQEIYTGGWYSSGRVADALRARFPDDEIELMREFPTSVENDHLLTKATGYRRIVFVTFCVSSAYMGTDCLTRRAESVINALIASGKVEALVHFGNPYAVTPLLHVPRLILGYHSPESQPAAVEVLAGEREAKGKLPLNVKLP